MSSILSPKFIVRQAIETLCSRHEVTYESSGYRNRAGLIFALQHIDAFIARHFTIWFLGDRK